MEQTNVVAEVGQNQVPKKKGLAIILCLLGGMIGLHKFYEGKIGMGILYVLTCGFMGIGVLIDLIKLIFKPSVYYVEKKNYRIDPESIKQKIVNFPLDRVGTIISCIGGGLIGLGASLEWKWNLMLIGLVIGVVGAVISFLKRKDIMDTLRVNGITIAISAVAVFAFLLLIAAVIVWIALKLLLGIDIVEWLMDVFGNGTEKKKGNGDGPFSTINMPDEINGPYGNTYHRVSSGLDSSTYANDIGDVVEIYNSEIEVSATGMYANTSSGYFYW